VGRGKVYPLENNEGGRELGRPLSAWALGASQYQNKEGYLTSYLVIQEKRDLSGFEKRMQIGQAKTGEGETTNIAVVSFAASFTKD